MKLEDVKDAPIEQRSQSAAPSMGGGGMITMTGRNGIRVCIPIEGLRMDPVTGEIDRAFWGVDDIRAGVGGMQHHRGRSWRDSHMGAIEL